MFRRSTSALVTLALVAGAATAAHAADPDPVARTKGLIAAFMAVKKPAEEGAALPAADKAANAAAFTAIDGFFDAQSIQDAPLAPHADKFKPAEKKEFGDTFWKLVRMVAYPDSGAFFRKASYKVVPAKAPAGLFAASIEATLEEDDIDTTVTFVFKPIDGALRITDVKFDGASLLKDYANQFGRIISKSGTAGLMAKLKTRYEEESRARKGLLP